MQAYILRLCLSQGGRRRLGVVDEIWLEVHKRFGNETRKWVPKKNARQRVQFAVAWAGQMAGEGYVGVGAGRYA